MNTYKKILLIVVVSPLLISSFLILDIGLSESNSLAIESMSIPLAFLGLFLFVFFRYNLEEPQSSEVIQE